MNAEMVRLYKHYSSTYRDLIDAAITSGKPNIYFLNKETSAFTPLTPGELNELIGKEKIVKVLQQGNLRYSTPAEARTFGISQNITLEDLFIDKNEVEKIVDTNQTSKNFDLTKRAKNTYDNIIAALLDIIFSERPNGAKMTPFENQAKLIEYLLDNYNDLPGISQRTLEEKFGNANKVRSGLKTK